MEFIDTHSHLYDEAFTGEEDAAIERSRQAGVGKIIFPDIDSSTRQTMFKIADRHQGVVFPCLGLHPTSIDAGWETEMEKLHESMNRRIWAIGEIGMDCYWSKDFVEQQKTALKIQLELADKMFLPVIIHSRESTSLIIKVLQECRHLNIRGVFHAFSGSAETFSELQRLGDWYVGIGGVLTYKKASIAETVKDIPLGRILLEMTPLTSHLFHSEADETKAATYPTLQQSLRKSLERTSRKSLRQPQQMLKTYSEYEHADTGFRKIIHSPDLHRRYHRHEGRPCNPGPQTI